MLKAFFYIVLFAFLLVGSNKSFSQTYNKIITDKEYYEFINSNISKDSVKVLHHVFRERIPWNPKLVYYKDSVDFAKKNNSEYKYNFIFHNHVLPNKRVLSNYLDTIFTREDIDFFGKQLNATKRTKNWKNDFANSILIDSVEYNYNGKSFFGREMKFGVWGYSLPLFSLNRKIVLIIKSNSVSSGYYIYRKDQNGNWEFIKTFDLVALDYF